MASSHIAKTCKGKLYWRTLLRSKYLPLYPNLDVSSPSKRIISTYFPHNSSLGGYYSSIQRDNKILPHHLYFPYRNFVANGNPDAGKGNDNASLPGTPPRNWKRWVLGILMSIIIPSFTHKLGPLGVWKDELDSRLQEIEDAVEEGEMVATAVEKAAERWLDSLPDGWLKDVLTIMEQGAERASKFFNKVDYAIDEFQEEEEKIVTNWTESAEDRTKVPEEALEK